MYFIGWGKEPKGQKALRQTTRPVQSEDNISVPTLRQLLGHLTQKRKAKRIYITTSIEGILECDALLDTGSEISLMSAKLFEELKKKTHVLGKWIRVEKLSD